MFTKLNYTVEDRLVYMLAQWVYFEIPIDTNLEQLFLDNCTYDSFVERYNKLKAELIRLIDGNSDDPEAKEIFLDHDLTEYNYIRTERIVRQMICIKTYNDLLTYMVLKRHDNKHTTPWHALDVWESEIYVNTNNTTDPKISLVLHYDLIEDVIITIDLQYDAYDDMIGYRIEFDDPETDICTVIKRKYFNSYLEPYIVHTIYKDITHWLDDYQEKRQCKHK